MPKVHETTNFFSINKKAFPFTLRGRLYIQSKVFFGLHHKHLDSRKRQAPYLTKGAHLGYFQGVKASHLSPSCVLTLEAPPQSVALQPLPLATRTDSSIPQGMSKLASTELVNILNLPTAKNVPLRDKHKRKLSLVQGINFQSQT